MSEKVISYWSYAGLSHKPKVVSIEKLFLILNQVTGVTEEQMRSPKRLRELSDARKIFILFLRRNTKLTTSKISSYLNRDHSTIVYALRETSKILDYDKDFKELYMKIEEMVLNPFIFRDIDESEKDEIVLRVSHGRDMNIKTIK